jgi:hypothetical protein
MCLSRKLTTKMPWSIIKYKNAHAADPVAIELKNIYVLLAILGADKALHSIHNL